MPRSWPLSGGKPSTWNRGDGYSAEDVVKVLVPACKKSDSQTQEGISIMTLNYKTTPDERRRRLRQLIQQKGFVRMIEAYNGLKALIGETAQIHKELIS